MIRLETVDALPSTNSAIDPDAPHGYALMARSQSAGRGQRGNTWEAEPGANITLSLMLRPVRLEAARQFALSEAVALGIVDTLDSLITGACIKWPNDIYVGDRKICGILIENSITGTFISRSIAGIGLNVNQTEFRSDAPNPVSLAQLTGRTYDVDKTARLMLDKIMTRVTTLGSHHSDFLRRLWRRNGFHPYSLPDGTEFDGRIVDVLPTGHLLLADRTDAVRRFAFKEVAARLH